MKRLGLIRNFLPATLFLALAATLPVGQLCAQDVLDALPPKPIAPKPAAKMLLPPDELPKMKETKQAAPAVTAELTPEEFRARLLERFDKNKDGRLDETERAAAKKYAEEHGINPGNPKRERMGKPAPSAETMRAEIRRRFDRNRNGQIDDEEMPALEQAVRTRLGSTPVLRQRYDKNGDGKIDEEEWAAARDNLQHWLNEATPAPEKSAVPSPEK